MITAAMGSKIARGNTRFARRTADATHADSQCEIVRGGEWERILAKNHAIKVERLDLKPLHVRATVP